MRAFRYWILIYCIVIFSAASEAADSTEVAVYSFDTSGFKAKPLDASASIELYPTLILYDRTAPLYSLKFRTGNRSNTDNYNLKTEAYLQYQHKPFLAFVSGVLNGAYIRQDDCLSWNNKIYEGYLKYTPNPSLLLLVGKRLFQWGKGYAFNPVSFAGRSKDLNDIDAKLEGYWNLSFEYVKSLDSPISSVALTGAFLPVYDLVNKDYLPDTTLAGIAQLYMLLLNTDVDMCFFADNRSDFKTGVDFSRNIFPDWEIHGEGAFIKNSSSTVFADESTMVNQSHPAYNLVAGTRYLAPFNTTFILEYLHVGSGYSRDEMSGYYKAINYANASGDPQRIQSILGVSTKYYSAQFITTHYVFFKASHPDPFNFVYFTPSIYAIVNILDRSMMAGSEMTYSRSRNLLLTGRYVAFFGDNETEYGSKLAQHRVELRAKWSF